MAEIGAAETGGSGDMTVRRASYCGCGVTDAAAAGKGDSPADDDSV